MVEALIRDIVIPYSPPFADVRTALRQVLLGDAGLLAWAAGSNPWSKAFALKVFEFGAPVDVEDVEIRIQDAGILPSLDWNSPCQWYVGRFFMWVMYTAANTSVAESLLYELEKVLAGVDLIRTTGVSGGKVCVQDIRHLGNVEPTPQLNGWGVSALYRARVGVAC